MLPFWWVVTVLASCVLALNLSEDSFAATSTVRHEEKARPNAPPPAGAYTEPGPAPASDQQALRFANALATRNRVSVTLAQLDAGLDLNTAKVPSKLGDSSGESPPVESTNSATFHAAASDTPLRHAGSDLGFDSHLVSGSSGFLF